MKRFLWAVMMLFVVFAPCAYADSIPTFNITQAIIPFISFGGDNEVFYFTGIGINFVGGGTATCDWCSYSLSPGSFLNPSVRVVSFDNTDGTAKIGGQTYSLNNGFLYNSSITALGVFRFPTNGRSSFTVSVPAVLNGPLHGFAPLLPSGNYNLQIPPYGTLVLTFTFSPAQNGFPASYQFSRGQFSVIPTPEPGTLGLMAMGLAGILGVKRWKALFRR
jgi:hypothetical protein